MFAYIKLSMNTFFAQASNSFSSYKKYILDVRLQDMTLQLTGPYQSITLRSTASQ